MIKGKVVNNTGRAKHAFKINVSPGMIVSLEYLYDLYKGRYEGSFDVAFLDWLQKNKLPEGFDLIVDDVKQEEETKVGQVVEDISSEDDFDVKKVPISKITARQIAGLKTKDNPKSVIGQVMSIHKLRRALTMTKDRAGKETLTRLIRERINDLHCSGIRE